MPGEGGGGESKRGHVVDVGHAAYSGAGDESTQAGSRKIRPVKALRGVAGPPVPSIHAGVADSDP
jgi:hypothetical protein